MNVSTREDKLETLRLLEERDRRAAGNKLLTYYPDTGPLRRELYVKHCQFFAAGKTKKERLMLAANRVGKTEGVGGFELVLHLTGKYPDWWIGKRFNRPISSWAAGDTGKTVRDIIQLKLLGKFNQFGTGLIPKDLLVKTTSKLGVAEAVDTIYVKHVSGGVSEVALKSYDQKRISFQGTEKDVIWLDEEPPLPIYTECLLRTMDTTGQSDGIIMSTFTPLEGLSETVLSFLPNGQIEEKDEGPKLVIMATWDDAPHLSQAAKDILMLSIPAYQRDARTKGIPQLGSGAIYPVPESEIMVNDFVIPIHWPRGYAMDVGWNKTAAGFYALDRDNQILYKTGEHYKGQAEPVIHAEAIKDRGKWLAGVIDPAARGRSQADGEMLMAKYIEHGLDLEPAFNGVESGIYEVWQRLSLGKLKVFKSCQKFFEEYRMYRRDEKGHIVKAMDHAMDETRYMVMSGIDRMKVKPVNEPESLDKYSSGTGDGWMG